jgi:hypothetical protein
MTGLKNKTQEVAKSVHGLGMYVFLGEVLQNM